MGRAGRVAVVLSIVASALTACEAPLGPGAADPSTGILAGEWIACLNDGASDYTRLMHFYPDSFSTVTRTYATTDRTCGGAETGASTEIWRYRLARAVPAHVGAAGVEVLASEMNVENSFVSLFTIVYVDRQASPAQLYFGDVALDPAQDGSAPERRPRLLDTSTMLTSH